MKIHTKVRYGLRAMIEICSHENAGGILQKDIAETQEIPLRYLDTIITGLKQAGLLINFSGRSSGYVLSRPANEISVYDVYRAFEPELNVVRCLCDGIECNRSDICPAKDYWSELNTEIKNSMKMSKLDQIAKKSNYLIVE